MLRADTSALDDDVIEALNIFFNWRASHALPMQTISVLLRRHSKLADPNSFVVQRLKRERSIFRKLLLQDKMQLSRMQDIAGCRAVVESLNKLVLLYSSLKLSKTKNKLVRVQNYVDKPKYSGYRGIHLIYKYEGSKTEWHGMLVEVQLRTQIQHSWATAVEVVGTFNNQALKASMGDKDWLVFFMLASAEFANLENCPKNKLLKDLDTFKGLFVYVNKLKVFDMLRAYTVSATVAGSPPSGKDYVVLRLDRSLRKVFHTWFSQDELKDAQKFYDDTEQEYKNDDNNDVVLVASSSVKELRKAYPNYFADTEEFRKNIFKVFEAHNYEVSETDGNIKLKKKDKKK